MVQDFGVNFQTAVMAVWTDVRFKKQLFIGEVYGN